jgi:3-deoxy-D-manno-octulosonic acid kinase
VNFHTQKANSEFIVYDANVIEQAGPDLFDGRYWERQGSIVGLAQGRGSALLLETAFGPAVLRRYLRGGWAAGISKDRYLFTGFARSRPLAELSMLAQLFAEGLPVPRPLAAQCTRTGCTYRGSLLMERVLDSTPLADLLADDSGGTEMWSAIGKCIRKFHDQGVVHSDLNARNILVRSTGAIYLIDFDRAKIRHGAGRAFRANLNRLRRSLEKFWPEAQSARRENCWSTLMDAYSRSPDC